MGTLSIGVSGSSRRASAPRPRSCRACCRSAPGCCCSRARRSTASYSSTSCLRWCSSGIGAGLSFPALMTLAMSGATPSDSGVASGLVNTSAGRRRGRPRRARDAGDRRTGGLVADGAGRSPRLNAGFHLAYVVGAGLVAAAGHRRRRAPRRRCGPAAAPSAEHERREDAHARARLLHGLSSPSPQSPQGRHSTASAVTPGARGRSGDAGLCPHPRHSCSRVPGPIASTAGAPARCIDAGNPSPAWSHRS